MTSDHASDLASDTLEARARRHLWLHFTRMSSYQGNDVPVIVRGSGQYVYDTRGKRYLDGLSGLFVSQIGHGRAGDRGPRIRLARAWVNDLTHLAGRGGDVFAVHEVAQHRRAHGFDPGRH